MISGSYLVSLSFCNITQEVFSIKTAQQRLVWVVLRYFPVKFFTPS